MLISLVEPEFSFIDSHLVQDDTKFAGECHLGALRSAPLGNIYCPGF